MRDGLAFSLSGCFNILLICYCISEEFVRASGRLPGPCIESDHITVFETIQAL